MSKKIPLILVCAVTLIVSSCQAKKLIPGVMRKAEPNEGPCPVALVLWDAARKVQIGQPEVYANVGFTGEITGVRSFCTYVGTDPIRADLKIDFAFGRGPAADGMEMEYPYFVSVTRKDRVIMAKEAYQMHIKFRDPDQIITRTEKIASITIPRKQKDTSGVNFEIIVGFELTENELAFARSGKRFRVDAGSRK